MHHHTPASTLIPAALRHACGLALFIALAAGAAGAQQSATDGTTPAGLAPGAPAGSYALSGFDTVNYFNGRLNFSLPLMKAAGRGGAGIPINLSIEQPWRARDEGGGTHSAVPNWWQDQFSAEMLAFSPGSLDVRTGGVGLDYQYCWGWVDPILFYGETLTRLTFTAPNGTEYELRDQKTGGKPFDTQLQCRTTGFNRGRVFVTADGSSVTFVSDDDVIDEVRPDEGGAVGLTGYMYLKDGTTFRIRWGAVTTMRDRNGNVISFEYYDGMSDAPAFTPIIPRYGAMLYRVTDSLGRQVTFNYDLNDAQYGVHDKITFKGFGGVDRAVRVSHARLHDRLRAGYTLQTPASLFRGLNVSSHTNYDPYKIAAVWLPDGVRSYQFRYNSHGELAEVTLPTGGVYQYDHDEGVEPAGNTRQGDVAWEVATYRRLVERREYADGGALTARMTVSRPEYVGTGGPPGPFPTRGYADVTHFDAAGTPLRTERHYFYGSAAASIGSAATGNALSYDPWRVGREYKTELLDGAGTLLRRTEQEWRQSPIGSWWGDPNSDGQLNNPRVVQTTTTLADTNQVSRQSSINPQSGTVGFDQYNNQTDLWEYDFGAGAPGPLLRYTHTDFLTTKTVGGAVYDYACDPSSTCGQNPGPNLIHQRALPTRISVYDAAGVEQARTTFEYDNYATDARHAPLVARPNITGLCTFYNSAGQCADTDPATGGGPTSRPARGNATGTTKYLLSGGAVTGSVTTNQQFDVAGNIVASVDANGKAATFDYGDSFCNPACGGTFKPNTFAFLTSHTTPPPGGPYSSATAFTTSTVYDFHTGLIASATDANGQTTSYQYADDLDRPTAVIRPAGGGRTDFDYGDVAGNLYVRVLADLDAGRRTESKQFFDGLGRPYRSLTYENQVQGTPWLTTDTRYDALGRVVRASLPYRSAGGGTQLTDAGWSNLKRSETTYDALGRALTTKTMPDAATVRTAYRGSLVQVTDQAGKSRRSESDALGRLKEVVEFTRTIPDPLAVENPLSTDYVTGYRYDVLDNLRRVDQGGQLRFFMYDSLGRLIRAKSPEQGGFASDADFPALTDSTSGSPNSQWSVGYAYDPNGTLHKRKDARNVVATYGYDALNRNTTIRYAGETGTPTPGVNLHYDGAAGGKGRLWKSETVQGSLTTVEEYDALGRPKKQKQEFWAGSDWGADFATQAVYNLAGGVTSVTYPSGHKADYRYDISGRLADHNGQAAFSGTLGDGTARAYVSQVLYDELGGMSQERFGTDTPVFNKRLYNSRGQLADIRVGLHPITSADPNLKTSWERGAILNHYSQAVWGGSDQYNNGNLITQQVWIPKGDDINVSGFALFEQSYTYDHLNRLRSVREGNYWQQTLNYDRWGNRTIDAANTWDTSQTNWHVNETQFTVDQNTNRLGVPAGQAGQMTYDAAGNLTHDTYTGGGSRAYDAEGRMTSAQFFSGQTQTASYTYDADGRRVKRNAGGGEVWQVYGPGSELLAEYAANTSPAQPLKEYGYRGGELLIMAEAGPGGTQGGGSAYGGTPASIPGTVQAEHFDEGGEGVGYHDTTPGSHGQDYDQPPSYPPPVFRQPTDVDIYKSAASYSGNHLIVGQAGDWMNYTVDVAAAGTYTMEARVAWGSAPGGTFHVEVDGSDVTGPLQIPDTNWTLQTISKPGVLLPAGRHVLRLVWDTNAAQGATGDIDFLRFVAGQPGGTPYGGTPASIPGFVQAEHFDEGGAGVGYHDTTAGSHGQDYDQAGWPIPSFRQPTDVDIYKSAGYSNSYLVLSQAGDWMKYSADISTAGTYTLRARVTWGGTNGVPGTFHVEVDGSDVTGPLQIPDANWALTTITKTGVQLPAGRHTLRVVADTNAPNGVTGDFDYFEFALESAAAGPAPAAAVRWVVSDQLGTPRMVLDKAGSLAGVTRHDYLPFGEELGGGISGRATQWGYGVNDNVRQKFASKERDAETGLDFFGARYYAATQGRLTGADPLSIESKRLNDPQRLNLFSYARNNPLKYIDPDGLDIRVIGTPDIQQEYLRDLNNRGDAQFRTAIIKGMLKIVDSSGKELNEGQLKALGSKLKGREAALFTAITDQNHHATINTGNGTAHPNILIGHAAAPGLNTLDYADIKLLGTADNAAGQTRSNAVAHETMEAYYSSLKPTDFQLGYPAHLKAGAADMFPGYDFVGNSVKYTKPDANGLVHGFTFDAFEQGKGQTGPTTVITNEFVTPVPAKSLPRLPNGDLSPHMHHLPGPANQTRFQATPPPK